jgi:hypothetical protein
LASFRKTTLRVCGAPAPKFTAILADAAWRQADAILRNEAKIIRGGALRLGRLSQENIFPRTTSKRNDFDPVVMVPL